MVQAARIPRRLAGALRYQPESISHPEARDFLAVTNKSGSEGVLLYDNTLLYPFTLQSRHANSTGRVEAIICDICATWQRGTNSASITFARSRTHSASFLVCADLACSLHVRDLTPAAQLSRTQLREHTTPDVRVARLHARLAAILNP